MFDRKVIALIVSTAAIAVTAAPAGASTTSPHQPQATDITAGLVEQPAAPRAAVPTTSESVKYTMFLPLEFDATKNEVSIETA
jgi:hypothetical protein